MVRRRLDVDTTYAGYVESPIGLIEVGATAEGVSSVSFVEARRPAVGSNPLVERALEQLAEYLAGTRQAFHVPLTWQGTDFQRMVWEQLLAIPYGETSSYGEIAEAIGRPRAARAVGMAVGQNPISIIVPCHRVIGSDGSLTGYGGGLRRKEWLLSHERSLPL